LSSERDKAVAHARVLPSLRLLRTDPPAEIDEAALPWILRGHPPTVTVFNLLFVGLQRPF